MDDPNVSSYLQRPLRTLEQARIDVALDRMPARRPDCPDCGSPADYKVATTTGQFAPRIDCPACGSINFVYPNPSGLMLEFPV